MGLEGRGEKRQWGMAARAQALIDTNKQLGVHELLRNDGNKANRHS